MLCHSLCLTNLLPYLNHVVEQEPQWKEYQKAYHPDHESKGAKDSTQAFAHEGKKKDCCGPS